MLQISLCSHLKEEFILGLTFFIINSILSFIFTKFHPFSNPISNIIEKPRFVDLILSLIKLIIEFLKSSGVIHSHSVGWKLLLMNSSIFLFFFSLEAGAIYFYDSNAWISNCIFLENKALEGAGGAILFDNNKQHSVIYSINLTNFTANIAKTEGGAIKYTNIIPNIQFCQYQKNYAVYGNNIASYPIRLSFQVYSNSDSNFLLF